MKYFLQLRNFNDLPFNLNHMSDNCETPLMLAVANKNHEMASLLL